MGVALAIATLVAVAVDVAVAVGGATKKLIDVGVVGSGIGVTVVGVALVCAGARVNSSMGVAVAGALGVAGGGNTWSSAAATVASTAPVASSAATLTAKWPSAGSGAVAIQVPAAVTVVVTSGVSSINTCTAEPGTPVPFSNNMASVSLSCTVMSLTISTGLSLVAAATSDVSGATEGLWSPPMTGEGVGGITNASCGVGDGAMSVTDKVVGVGASAICPGPSSTGVISRMIMTRPPNSAARPAFTS